jgi:glutathione synthase/RimK-type ligase-like ATP-grasp enzyme
LRTIDILIPSPAEASYHGEALEQARAYVDAFAHAGLDLRPLPWTDPQAGSAPALALLAWGYHLNLPAWTTLLDGWTTDVPLFNSPALMRWNTRKTYLAELESAGVPTVPTLFGNAGPEAIAAAFDRLGADELIVKPQVSAGSHQTYRLKRGDHFPALPEAMVQPFLPAIQDEGEYSLFYIGGALTHAIVKRATDGDFRIQPQFGGVNESWEPEAEALAVAETALANAPIAATYARIDLLRRLDGKLALIEFEAIEPDLYSHHGEGVLKQLAAAVATSL